MSSRRGTFISTDQSRNQPRLGTFGFTAPHTLLAITGPTPLSRSLLPPPTCRVDKLRVTGEQRFMRDKFGSEVEVEFRMFE